MQSHQNFQSESSYKQFHNSRFVNLSSLQAIKAHWGSRIINLQHDEEIGWLILSSKRLHLQGSPIFILKIVERTQTVLWYIYCGRITSSPAEQIRGEGRDSHCSALYTILKTYVHLPHCSEVTWGRMFAGKDRVWDCAHVYSNDTPHLLQPCPDFSLCGYRSGQHV